MNGNHEHLMIDERIRQLEAEAFRMHEEAMTRQHEQRQRQEALRRQRLRLTLATPDVEVVTSRTSRGTFETMVNGGELDGERFISKSNPDRQHDDVCALARQMAGR